MIYFQIGLKTIVLFLTIYMPKSSGNYRQNVVTHLLEYYSKRTVKLKKREENDATQINNK